MNTIKIDKYFKGMVAHRGLSGIETENTLLAFVAAANRSYYGIECDIHPTKDKKYVVSHDDSLYRLGLLDIYIPSFKYDELLKFSLIDKKTGSLSEKIVLPTLEEYLVICNTYDKVAFIELKETLSIDDIDNVMKIIAKNIRLDRVVIISFEQRYLSHIRKNNPDITLLLLARKYTESIYDFCVKHHIGLDVYYDQIDEQLVENYHLVGLKVAVWTVDDKVVCERLIKKGVDFITTNILE